MGNREGLSEGVDSTSPNNLPGSYVGQEKLRGRGTLSVASYSILT